MKLLLMDASRCPLCGSKKIKFNEKTNEFFCGECGYVLNEKISIEPNVEVGKVFVNPKEKKIAVVIKGILRGKLEKKMVPFYADIRKFSFPKYVEKDVLNLARKAVEEKLTMSFSKLEILASLIYYVCKREGIPILLRELERKLNVNRKRILRCYKFLVKRLNLNEKIPLEADSYIIRISSELGFNGKLTTLAIDISRKLRISHPVVRAVVAVWLASKKIGTKIKKKDLSRVSGISETAIRKNLSKL
jgi:transcription initiation factor TFIIIB Brf1 subunit/transcription initiation factor TFIIB